MAPPSGLTLTLPQTRPTHNRSANPLNPFKKHGKINVARGS